MYLYLPDKAQAEFAEIFQRLNGRDATPKELSEEMESFKSLFLLLHNHD